MIKCETIKDFTLQRFDELKNIQRRRIDEKGKLFVGDTFECTKEMADYLMGANKDGQVVVKVIEIEPEYEKMTLTHGDIIKENVTPLRDKEELDKLGEEVLKHIKPTKKKKSSKK